MDHLWYPDIPQWSIKVLHPPKKSYRPKKHFLRRMQNKNLVKITPDRQTYCLFSASEQIWAKEQKSFESIFVFLRANDNQPLDESVGLS